MGVTTPESLPEILPFVEKPGNECGVVGVYFPGGENNASLILEALHSQQHRGESAAGIGATHKFIGHVIFKGNGLVSEVFNGGEVSGRAAILAMDEYGSDVALGHTRYSTDASAEGAQPFEAFNVYGVINGHGENAKRLLPSIGYDEDDAVTDSHAQIIGVGHYYEQTGDLSKAVNSFMCDVEGAYSMILSDGKQMVAVRDPQGIHPLVLGSLPSGGFMVASETVAITDQGGTVIRDLVPGEILTIDEDGFSRSALDRTEPMALCAYEYGYKARPDGVLEGAEVFAVRRELGRLLAEDELLRPDRVEADIVVGVPSSGLAAAEGFASVMDMERVIGIERSPYVGRSFIHRAEDRERILRQKFRFVRSELEGKRIMLVDDSLIKGNTMKALIHLLKSEGGVSEVHVRFSMPQYRHPCYMGMDTSKVNELAASRMTDEEIRQMIGADSICFLNPERVAQAVNTVRQKSGVTSNIGGLCLACHDGKYPIDLQKALGGPVLLGMPTARIAQI